MSQEYGCKGKKSYTFSALEKKLKKINKNKRAVKVGYKCKHCLSWHMSSRE